MNILYSEIKKLANIPDSVSAYEFAEKLTAHTVEVDAVQPLAPECSGFVVGVIESITPHPDADRLKIATVNHGGTALAQVVCGGVNIYEGMRVVYARPGVKVRWHGEGDPVTLEPVPVRGVMSDGMICAANEVGLGHLIVQKEKEVVDLTAWGGVPGEDIARVLGLDDYCIEVDNKSITNRPDLWGYWGMAREASAIFGTKLALPEIHPPTSGSADIEFEVQTDRCLAYAGATVRCIQGAHTPWSILKVLAIAGIVSRHPVVDRANYAMLMTGQPFHAFDHDKVGEKIVVRLADKVETFVGLDGTPRLLEDGDIVIANKKEVLALAGIIGGRESAVTDMTTRIALESAVFDGLAIRKTSQRNALRTDASARYEKRLDPTRTEQSLHYLVELLRDVVDVDSIGITQVVQPSVQEGVVNVSASKIRSMLGFSVDHIRIESILASLGFGVVYDTHDDIFQISVPSWRATGDIASPEDVIEEIARMYGYAYIQGEPVQASAMRDDMQRMHTATDARKRAGDVARALLVGAYGAHECIGYPFLHENDRKKYFTETAQAGLVGLKNVVNEEERYLRPTQIFGLMNTARERMKAGTRKGVVFEVGHVFTMDHGRYDIGGHDTGTLPAQPLMLTVVGWGQESWFESAKGFVEAYLRALDRDASSLEWNMVSETSNKVYGNQCVLAKNHAREDVSCMGAVARRDGVTVTAHMFALELNVDTLLSMPSMQWMYRPGNPYPTISLDQTIECDQSVTWYQVLDGIQRVQHGVSADDVQVQGIYFVGSTQVGSEHEAATKRKSITYRLEIGSPFRTLQKHEAISLQARVRNQLLDMFPSMTCESMEDGNH